VLTPEEETSIGVWSGVSSSVIPIVKTYCLCLCLYFEVILFHFNITVSGLVVSLNVPLFSVSSLNMVGFTPLYLKITKSHSSNFQVLHIVQSVPLA
jgi:hypothetical protein